MLRNPLIFKMISQVVIAALILESSAYGNATIPVSRMPHSNVNGEPLSRSLGDGARFNQLPLPDVWIIEDAHSSLDAQLQIAQIIQTLHAMAPTSFVGLEGHSGAVANNFIKAFPDNEIRKMVAYALLQEAKISAAEYAAIVSDDDIKVLGIENPKAYAENWAAYQKIRSEIIRLKPVFEKWSVLTDRIGKDVLSRKLERWLKLSRKMHAATFDEHWLNDIKDALRELKSTGFEAQKLNLLLNEKPVASKISVEEWREEIDRVLDRIVMLESRSALELKTVNLIHKLDQIYRMLSAEALRQDVTEVESSRATQFGDIFKLIQELTGTDYSEVIPGKEWRQLHEHFNAALLFYKGAIAREKGMVRSIINYKKMAGSIGPSILVVGGLHTEGLVREFELQHINAVVLRPKSFSLDASRAIENRFKEVLSARQLQSRFTEVLYAMFGYAMLLGGNLKELQQEYLSRLSVAESANGVRTYYNRKPSFPAERILAAPKQFSKNAINSPTILRPEYVPTMETVGSEVNALTGERNRQNVVLSTLHGKRLVTKSERGVKMIPVDSRSELRKSRPFLQTFIAALLLGILPACSMVASDSRDLNAHILTTSKEQEPEPVQFTLPTLTNTSEESSQRPVISSSTSGDDLFSLARRTSGELTASSQPAQKSAASQIAHDSSRPSDYDQLPRIQIVSPLTKADSCPLCNQMTQDEFAKLQAVGAVSELEDFKGTKFEPSAIEVLRDRNRDWVERYKAIMNLTLNQNREGIRTAHDLLKSYSGDDPYGFWNAEGARILRALSPQWLVMAGPNRADLDVIVRYGLNDPDDLVRFMSAEALRKAADADKAGVFSEDLRKDAAIRIAQICQEDPSLFARYGAYLALPKIAGLDRSTSIIRYGLEKEKDYYVLKAVVQGALDHPSESYTEGLLELLKRQPPERTPALVRAYGELKIQVRQVIKKLAAIPEFRDGVKNALFRKFAQNDMYTVTVGMNDSLQQFAALLIDMRGSEKAAESLREWLLDGRNLPLRFIDEDDPRLKTIEAWNRAADEKQAELIELLPNKTRIFLDKAFFPTETQNDENKEAPKQRLINSAYLAEILVSPGVDSEFRSLAATLLGQHLAIDAEFSLVAALQDKNDQVVAAALKSLQRIEAWKLMSGFSAYDSDFTRALTQTLSIGIQGKAFLLPKIYSEPTASSTLVPRSWNSESKKLALDLIQVLQGDDGFRSVLREIAELGFMKDSDFFLYILVSLDPNQADDLQLALDLMPRTLVQSKAGIQAAGIVDWLQKSENAVQVSGEVLSFVQDDTHSPRFSRAFVQEIEMRLASKLQEKSEPVKLDVIPSTPETPPVEIQEPKPSTTTLKADTKTIYYCPMHPEVISDKPGKCETCGGMELIKKEIPPSKSLNDSSEKKQSSINGSDLFAKSYSYAVFGILAFALASIMFFVKRAHQPNNTNTLISEAKNRVRMANQRVDQAMQSDDVNLIRKAESNMWIEVARAKKLGVQFTVEEESRHRGMVEARIQFLESFHRIKKLIQDGSENRDEIQAAVRNLANVTMHAEKRQVRVRELKDWIEPIRQFAKNRRSELRKELEIVTSHPQRNIEEKINSVVRTELRARRLKAFMLLFSLVSVVATCTSCSQWRNPVKTQSAPEVAARFDGNVVVLTPNDLWAATERNLDVRLAQIELWRQDAEANRLRPSWNIEIAGGFSGDQPIVGANISMKTSAYGSTINLATIYDSKGLSLASELTGAILRELFGTTLQAKELQKSLTLSLYYRLQETILVQYEESANLLIDLHQNQAEIEILRGHLTSLERLIRLVPPADSVSQAAENRRMRLEAQALLPQVKSELLRLEVERKTIEAKLMRIISDSALDAGRQIVPTLDFNLTQDRLKVVSEKSDETFTQAAARNPSILSANSDHAAAQQALALFDKSRKATLNVGGFLGTKSNNPTMTGPVFSELAGRPIESYRTVKTEAGLGLQIPFGGELLADRAKAQAEIAKAEVEVQKMRRDFSGEYSNAFRSIELLTAELAEESLALNRLALLLPGGAQYDSSASVRMRLDQLEQLRVILVAIAQTKAKIMKLEVRFSVLGALPYPWETKPRSELRRIQAVHSRKNTDGSMALGWRRALSLLSAEKDDQRSPFISEATAEKRIHVVDAALLDTNRLAELSKSSPNAFWIFLFDESDTNKKLFLERELRHQDGFRGRLILSPDPYQELAGILEIEKVSGNLIAVGIDEKVSRLPENRFPLRLQVKWDFWMRKVRDPNMQLQVLKLVFGALPPHELSKGAFDIGDYLDRAFDFWQRAIQVQVKVAASA